jgi:hypothetical protein
MFFENIYVLKTAYFKEITFIQKDLLAQDHIWKLKKNLL